MNSTRRDAADLTLGDHLADLGHELETLVDKELELTRLEMRTAIRTSMQTTFTLGAASTILTTGLVFLLAAVVIGLSTVMPAWLAAGTIGVALLVVGGGIAKRAKTLMAQVGEVAEDMVEEAQETEHAVAEGVR